MMAGPNRDAGAIDDRAEIVRMDAVNDERQDAGFVPGRADDADALDAGEPLGGVREQLRFMLGGTRFRPTLCT